MSCTKAHRSVAQVFFPMVAWSLFLAGSAMAQSLVVPPTPVIVIPFPVHLRDTSVLAVPGVTPYVIVLGNVPATGSSFSNGAYPAWCAAWYSSPFDPSSPDGYLLYSTVGSMPPPSGDEPLTDAYTFNMVNYILNHKQGTVKDVQDAIWLIMTGQTEPSVAPAAAALAMRDAAVSFGAAYIPAYPGVMAVFMSVGPDLLAPTATDGALVAQSLFLEVPVPQPLAVHTQPTLSCSSASGTINTTYNSSLKATGGTSPYYFSIISGFLPGGLTLNSSTGAITGVPNTATVFSFTAKVLDATSGTDNATTSTCTINISGVGNVSCGDTATIGFWANKNGQYVIQNVNAGPASTNLGNWLASAYPALFGGLAGKTNTQVAAQFTTYFKVSGAKVQAQIMAGALEAYVTNTALSGTASATRTARTKFGFNSSITGTGAKLYNVGSYGSALGLANYTSYSVSYLLCQANLRQSLGTLDATAANAVFDGINQLGDIK